MSLYIERGILTFPAARRCDNENINLLNAEILEKAQEERRSAAVFGGAVNGGHLCAAYVDKRARGSGFPRSV